LNGITPEELAKAIKEKRAFAKEDKSRHLPAQGKDAYGVNVWLGDRAVAQIADKDVPTFQILGELKGEVICYGRSLRLVEVVR